MIDLCNCGSWDGSHPGDCTLIRPNVDQHGHPYEQTLLDLLTDYHNKDDR